MQGRPAWLDEIWREWREHGVVVWHEGRWTVAPDARDRACLSLHGRVENALHAAVAPDSDAFWRAREILRTAALEGQRFTAEALAGVLGDDVEELIDWIDDHLADLDSPSPLVEDGFVERAEGLDPPALRCYRFDSALVAGVLRQEALGDEREVAGREVRPGAGAGVSVSTASSAAWTISRLATAAGDEELVEYAGGGRTGWRAWKRRRGWRGSWSSSSILDDCR